MKKHFIIDAYNLLHKFFSDENNFSLKNKITAKNLQGRRSQIEKFLNESDVLSNSEITLVYDGSGHFTSHREGRFTILFSQSGKSADSVIKSLIDETQQNRKRSLTIISSDRSVSDYARVSGIEHLKSEDFLTMLHSRETSEFKKIHTKDRPLSEKEIVEWKKIFE